MSRMRHSRRLRGIQSARYFAAARSRVPAKDAELAGHPRLRRKGQLQDPSPAGRSRAARPAGATRPHPLSLEGITVMQSRWNASMMESRHSIKPSIRRDIMP